MRPIACRFVSSQFPGLALPPLAALAVALMGCGDRAPSPAPLAALSACMGGWEPLLSRPAYDITSPLAYRDGVIYFSSFKTRSLVALPTDGGPTVDVAPVFSRDLWVEGDNLVYTGGPLGNQLFSVPVTGGTPTLVLDGGAGRTEPLLALLTVLTASDFFWTEGVIEGPTQFWRASRAGGAPTEIGSTTATTPSGHVVSFESMAVSNDALVAATVLGVADAVPFNQDPVRPLATTDALGKGFGSLAGVDGAGAYWSLPRPGGLPEDDENDVVLSPADGGPVRPFWNGLPPHSGVFSMWPDGVGGWVVVAPERFDDQLFHTTIWLLGGDGSSRRLACSPGDSGDADVRVRPVVTPDAVFVATTGSYSLEIVRIPR
jgi:hypothetical protein